MKPALEVADIFRRHGAAYRDDQAATLSNSQRRVMAAIETCRTSALGGHVERCADCGEVRISYNSCLMGKSSNGELAATLSCSSACRRQSSSPLRSALEERDQSVGRLERAAPQMRWNDRFHGV
jgi:hypothetical protein